MFVRRMLFAVLFALFALLPLAGCARTTPTEAAALEAARHDPTAYTLPPATLRRAQSLEHSRVAQYWVGTVWGILELFLLLQLRVVARMRNVAVNLSKSRWVQGFVFVLELLVVITLLNLPLGVWGHATSLHYGLSVQGWGGWLLDLLKSLLIELVLGWLGVMLLFWRIRRSPRLWWVQLWAVICCLVVVGVFLTPYVIDPLFNRFEPLERTDPALVAELERVVGNGHGIAIPPDRMFLMKASSKVTTLNAYVTGFGASKRVVVWDTSIRKFTPDEIALVFGHEMGHYVLHHIVYGVLESFLILFVSFGIAFYALGWLVRTRGKLWRVPDQGNWGALGMLLLIFAVLGFLLQPLESALSREDEHAADVYGQEVVHGIVQNPQDAGQRSFDLLGENSLDPPDSNAFMQFWTGSHPAIALRAAFAKHYNPWVPGAAPKYFPPAPVGGRP